MSIEKNLDRIADALETLVAFTAGSVTITPISSSSTKPAQSEKKSSKASSKNSSDEASSAEVSKDDVREALKNLHKSKGAAAARELLGSYGCKTLTDLDVEKYAAVIEAAEEAARD